MTGYMKPIERLHSATQQLHRAKLDNDTLLGQLESQLMIYFTLEMITARTDSFEIRKMAILPDRLHQLHVAVADVDVAEPV